MEVSGVLIYSRVVRRELELYEKVAEVFEKASRAKGRSEVRDHLKKLLEILGVTTTHDALKNSIIMRAEAGLTFLVSTSHYIIKVVKRTDEIKVEVKWKCRMPGGEGIVLPSGV